MLLTARVLSKRSKLPSLNSIGYAAKHITMGWRDDWPSGPDGNQYDGKQLMDLVRNDNSPFQGVWDVKLLIQEIEEKLNIQVTDIPIVDKGSNNYVGSRLYIRGRINQNVIQSNPCLGFPPKDLE